MCLAVIYAVDSLALIKEENGCCVSLLAPGRTRKVHKIILIFGLSLILLEIVNHFQAHLNAKFPGVGDHLF
jgi:hypothetical protein